MPIGAQFLKENVEQCTGTLPGTPEKFHIQQKHKYKNHMIKDLK